MITKDIKSGSQVKVVSTERDYIQQYLGRTGTALWDMNWAFDLEGGHRSPEAGENFSEHPEIEPLWVVKFHNGDQYQLLERELEVIG